MVSVSYTHLDVYKRQDFDWSGAHTVKVYKVSTVPMEDYDRAGTGKNASRYGALQNLNATTEEFTLKKDRSFTFAIDKLDIDETGNQVGAAAALARQLREVVIPEIDEYVYKAMCDNAGTKPEAVTLTAENIYDEIIKAGAVLDLSLIHIYHFLRQYLLYRLQTIFYRF